MLDRSLWFQLYQSSRLSITLILALFSLLPEVAGQQLTPRLFKDPSMSNIKGFYEYLPAGYTPGSGKQYPLIIFFHGRGELAATGAPLSAVLKNGLPRIIADGQFPASFTVNDQQVAFIVISPQFNSWPGAADALKFKDYLQTKYDIDSNRIYVTGISMGGGEAWGAICENKEGARAFAAAVIVCGYYVPTAILAANIANNHIPVWVLHNKEDPNVPVQYSIDWVKMINAVDPAPDPPAKLTVFDAAGHDAWSKAYDPAYKENGMNIYEWMLQYTKSRIVPKLFNLLLSPQASGAKRIIVPVSNRANGRAEMFYADAMTSLNVKPGDTLCIPAGSYEYLSLGKLQGTPDKPIVIINCGGQVKLGVNNQGTGAVCNMSTCKYVELSGAGDSHIEYGFDLNGTNVSGLRIFGLIWGEGSTDFDVHHVYIHDGGILLQAKTLQSCAQPQYLEGSFVMKNVKLHHIKCRNAQWECFYVGNTHYFWDDSSCKNMRSHWIEHLWIYDNDLKNIGSDAIQMAMVQKGDNRVFNNRIVNYGISQNAAHGYGILAGSGCSLKIYNNFIMHGYMPAITIFGTGINEVYNNVITDIYYEGINVTDKIPEYAAPGLFPPATAIIYNNTIVNTDHGLDGIKIFAYQTTTGHLIYNNLMVQQGTSYDYPATGLYIKGEGPIKLAYGNNLCYPDVSKAGFVDAAHQDYRLQPSSPAVNSGQDMRAAGLFTDFINTLRPQQGKYDVGAFELKLEQPVH